MYNKLTYLCTTNCFLRVKSELQLLIAYTTYGNFTGSAILGIYFHPLIVKGRITSEKPEQLILTLRTRLGEFRRIGAVTPTSVSRTP